MALTPGDIIEAIVDELAMGDIAEQVPDLSITRLGPGTLLLDYGTEGRFRLAVVPEA